MDKFKKVERATLLQGTKECGRCHIVLKLGFFPLVKGQYSQYCKKCKKKFGLFG